MPSKYPPALVPKQLKGLLLQGQALWPQGAPRPLQQTWAVCSHFFWLIPPLASKHFSHSLLCARRKRKATSWTAYRESWEIKACSSCLGWSHLSFLLLPPREDAPKGDLRAGLRSAGASAWLLPPFTATLSLPLRPSLPQGRAFCSSPFSWRALSPHLTCSSPAIHPEDFRLTWGQRMETGVPGLWNRGWEPQQGSWVRMWEPP